MTIEEMRREMRREVVPEEVIPQNVINFLIDEDAEPPKLDAFSFLMRLRALGIGSDDFLNLLEGCDAPESVVNKIRQNPAMNLQGLILTLENSELTSDDYTRMLLTARQVWERTLTLRLEKSEKLSREIPADFIDEESDDAPVKVYGEPTNVDADEQTEDDTEYPEDGETDEYYDEDMLEMSFTAVLEKINSESHGEISSEQEAESMPDPQHTDGEETDEENRDGEAQSSDDETVSDNETELSFAEAFDKIKSEKLNNTAGGEPTDPSIVEEQTESGDDMTSETSEDSTNATDTTDTTEATVDTATLIQIDGEFLRENFGKLSIISESSEETDEDDTDAPENSSEKVPKTAKQKKSEKVKDTPSEADEENDEDYDSGAANSSEENSEDTRVGYHKGAMIGSAVGAAVLIGAGLFAGQFLGGNNTNDLHYASDNYEIFEKISVAHGDSTPGGSKICSIGDDHRAIFGDLLISSEDGAKSPGSFSIGSGLYSITEEAISVNIVENGTITSLDDLIPPENCRFVAAFDENGDLYALFSGKQSGFMKISDGETKYTVRQDGVLTDYGVLSGEIRLGTVYTPIFEHTFNINDEEVYLPKLGTDKPEPISAKNVIVSNTKGYSYGVSASYSTENGKIKNVCAVIGDPVTASADGCFALNGDNGLLVKTDGDKLNARHTEKLTYAVFGKNGCAIAEENAPESIKLLDNELNIVSSLTNIKEKIEIMRFEGSILTIRCANSLYAVECSSIDAPKEMKLKALNGITAGQQSALTLEINGGSLLITRYDLINGTAEKVGEYSKTLTADQLATVKIGDPKTAVFDGSKSGVAYSYFDGVSVVSEYVVFGDGARPETVSVFDDKTGFTAAFKDGSTVKAVCTQGIKVLQ